MTDDTPKGAGEAPSVELSRLLDDRASLVEKLYAQSQARRWGLSLKCFAGALERGARKFFTAGAVSSQKLEDFLAALRLEDLALACACAEGAEAAWEHFFSCYRPYLRAAAAAILRCRAGSAEACELADSLFSDLYGLADGKVSERSLFRYFHGRSSLKTWLRAVLAQRHIDAIRAGRRFEVLEEDDAPGGDQKTAATPPIPLSDPHRPRYLALFSCALQSAFECLAPAEKERLRLYYNEEKTLAEIGRLLGEHESSVSRHLDSVRRDLRTQVEDILRRGFVAANGSAAQPGLSEAEIALCFEYGAVDAPIDLDQLLPRPNTPGTVSGKRPL